MASIGQIWQDPDGNKWAITGESGAMVLVAGQWMGSNLEASGWVFIR